MNKKNILFILTGVLILILQFNVKISNIYIDLFNDTIAFILIIIGGLPLSNRNIEFKKARNVMILGLFLTIIGQIFSIYNSIKGGNDIIAIYTGFSTIAGIYFTYYFNEALVLESQFQEKLAVTRSFKLIWAILGILMFCNFLAIMSGKNMMIIIVKAVTVIYAIYYCSVVLTGCKQLYMEGLPTKHMMK